MSIYRDDGIVLRTQKLGEADRIVTVLARKSGRVRAVAKGVRKTKSRFGARLEPFTHVDLLLYTGRTLDVITQAETVRSYGEALTGDYPRYTTGTAMLETAERFTAIEKEPALRQFLLLVGGLRTLVDGGHEPRLVLDAYLLRSLAVAGYAPALEECAICGSRAPSGSPSAESRPAESAPAESAPAEPAPDGKVQAATTPRRGPVRRTFGVAAGGLVCRSCWAPGAAIAASPTIDLMSALLRGDWGIADASERRYRVECSGLVAAYVQWHLEHSIRSLRHVEHA
ncbi:MAG TPA: DNA repair protein RecO [Streptosporangiaceae bacterium]|nr:DNA repair protein RecO [Streptosporangiaceae bacterium]